MDKFDSLAGLVCFLVLLFFVGKIILSDIFSTLEKQQHDELHKQHAEQLRLDAERYQERLNEIGRGRIDIGYVFDYEDWLLDKQDHQRNGTHYEVINI
ncbi:hypothetical protein AVT69_gp190 [Pseudomonas phage PhiPA3]|uniref:Uncharacterized protein 192 n=1 Tax=Pseudomonas phage PhiPA3 TaxID=998086 RepID=F8SK61_BPPA3|nr:hypothetical protein AVT69_gp190 [Pseudomonas phage PhiPA3]AEH03615.1 hypothetical protein [Pseudomonas phage PhiPA3]